MPTGGLSVRPSLLAGLRRFRIRLMDTESIALSVEVVALPGHPGQCHLRHATCPPASSMRRSVSS